MNYNSKSNKYKIPTKFMLKFLITIIITLTILILIKSSSSFKTSFYKYVFEYNFSFSKVNSLYEKYIGKSLPLKEIVETTEPVFNETITYTEKTKYQDGVSLTVTDNYLIPIQESGIIVYIGEKEGYNNVVIIQQVNGIDMWYGNIENVNVKLYDYVEKGTLLGECNKLLYLVYKKDGKVLNYEDYI